MKAAIIVPLPQEAQSLTRQKLTFGQVFPLAEDLAIFQSGMGPQAIEQAVRTLASQQYTHLLSWGTAVGLSPEIQVGDILLPEYITDTHGKKWPISPAWFQEVEPLVKKLPQCHKGPMAGAEVLLHTQEDKQVLYQQTGALAADMESLALAQAAQKHQLEFLVIRAVSDTQDMRLPRPVIQALDERGNLQVLKFLGGLARYPQDILPLIKLARGFFRARKSLKLVAYTLWQIKP